MSTGAPPKKEAHYKITTGANDTATLTRVCTRTLAQANTRLPIWIAYLRLRPGSHPSNSPHLNSTLLVDHGMTPPLGIPGSLRLPSPTSQPV